MNQDPSELQKRIAHFVDSYQAIGLSWHDVLTAVEQARNRKVQEILLSTFSSLSMKDLIEVGSMARERLAPPRYEPPAAPSAPAKSSKRSR